MKRYVYLSPIDTNTKRVGDELRISYHGGLFISKGDIVYLAGFGYLIANRVRYLKDSQTLECAIYRGQLFGGVKAYE